MATSSLLRRPFRYSYFNATLYLIAINILVFAVSYVFPTLNEYISLNPAMVLSGYVWQIGTYMFAHANLAHIFFNMLGLFFFGRAVERSMGSKEFLLFYLLSGILSGFVSFIIFVIAGAWNIMLLGASGAIFAVLLAFAILYPDALVYIYGIIPLRAPVMVLGYAAIEIGSQILSFSTSVAHYTHLAGFAAGWLYFLVRFGVNPAKRLFRRRH